VAAGSVPVGRGRGGAVAGVLDGRHELLDRDGRRHVHRGRLGRVVDGGADALELVEPALDAAGAGGAGHPGDRELHACGGGRDVHGSGDVVAGVVDGAADLRVGEGAGDGDLLRGDVDGDVVTPATCLTSRSIAWRQCEQEMPGTV
jgi:hypothetical protein